MNTLRSPISVTPPPPRVPRWIVTNSRKMLRLPMTSRVSSPRNFRSCGIEADRRERIDLGAVADLGPAVDDRRRADPAVRRRSSRAAPMTACGPIVVPSPICARGCTMAVGSISVRSGTQAEQQLAFGDDLIADVRGRLRARQRRARAGRARLRAAAGRPARPAGGISRR